MITNYYKKEYIIEINIQDNIKLCRTEYDAIISYYINIDGNFAPVPKQFFIDIFKTQKYEVLEYYQYSYLTDDYQEKIIKEFI